LEEWPITLECAIWESNERTNEGEDTGVKGEKGQKGYKLPGNIVCAKEGGGESGYKSE